jgi:hypothetical protein
MKKCIFFSLFGVLLGHIVCKQGLMVEPSKVAIIVDLSPPNSVKGLLVEPSKVAIIVDLSPPNSVKQLCTALGHTGYYRKFIKGYAQIITPMEKILKKYCQFSWTEECQ